MILAVALGWGIVAAGAVLGLYRRIEITRRTLRDRDPLAAADAARAGPGGRVAGRHDGAPRCRCALPAPPSPPSRRCDAHRAPDRGRSRGCRGGRRLLDVPGGRGRGVLEPASPRGRFGGSRSRDGDRCLVRRRIGRGRHTRAQRAPIDGDAAHEHAPRVAGVGVACPPGAGGPGGRPAPRRSSRRARFPCACSSPSCSVSCLRSRCSRSFPCCSTASRCDPHAHAAPASTTGVRCA